MKPIGNQVPPNLILCEKCSQLITDENGYQVCKVALTKNDSIIMGINYFSKKYGTIPQFVGGQLNSYYIKNFEFVVPTECFYSLEQLVSYDEEKNKTFFTKIKEYVKKILGIKTERVYTDPDRIHH